MAEILVVDDERIVRTAIKDMLTENGFSVRLSHRGVHAVEQFLAKRPDLVLLDVMMPGKTGFEVCREIRVVDRTTPVLFLTSAATEVNQVRAFGLGADDCISKNAGEAELVARIRRALERAASFKESVALPRRTQIGRLSVDFDALTACGPGVEVKLTKTEGDILWLLNTERGRFFSQDEILEVVRSSGVFSEGLLRTHFSRLRRKLGTAAGMIASLRGSGYKLVD